MKRKVFINNNRGAERRKAVKATYESLWLRRCRSRKERRLRDTGTYIDIILQRSMNVRLEQHINNGFL